MDHARLTYPKKLRMRKKSEFDAVYQSRVAIVVGRLRILGKPNGLVHCRIGFNVSKRVGNAVTRNRIKRLLREAFRQSQHDLSKNDSAGMDLLVIVRPGEELELAWCREAILKAVRKLRAKWDKMEGKA